MAKAILVHLLHHVYQAIFGLHLPLAIRIKNFFLGVRGDLWWKSVNGKNMENTWNDNVFHPFTSLVLIPIWWLLISDECWNQHIGKVPNRIASWCKANLQLSLWMMVAGVWCNSLMDKLLNMLKKSVLFHSSKSSFRKNICRWLLMDVLRMQQRQWNPEDCLAVCLISLEAHPSKLDVGFANLYELL